MVHGSNTLKLSDYVMRFLFEHKIRYVFGYQGGSVTHLIDSLHKVEGLTYIQNYHEQASSFSADAYARVHGGFGVAIATSGPGATNLITGIASAFFDSVPCLFKLSGNRYRFHRKADYEVCGDCFGARGDSLLP
jgi:acetolactate synthase-1/2/3 large subunit